MRAGSSAWGGSGKVPGERRAPPLASTPLGDATNISLQKRHQILFGPSLMDITVHSKNTLLQKSHVFKLHCATKFGSCLVLGVLTVGFYSLVIKTTETAIFSVVKIRSGSGEFFL